MFLGQQFKLDFNQYDKSKKDEAWANRLLSVLRMHMVHMIDPEHAAINRSYMLGSQDMEQYKKKFENPENLPFDFKPLKVFEKYRQILFAERDKAGLEIRCKAIDPTAQEEMDTDKEILKNRRVINDTMSDANQMVGLPEYNVMNDKSEDGGKLFNGNLHDFDDMGLDDSSDDDVSHFFKNYYRLDVSTEMESALNFFKEFNELHTYIEKFCDDIIAVKAIASRVFTEEMSFSQKFEYYRPEQIRWIRGKRNDGKDAKAFMVEENMTVSEFLEISGTDVTPEALDEILTAVNTFNGTNYDGVYYGTETGDEDNIINRCVNPISYTDFVGMSVGIGYAEWKSISVDAKKVGKDMKGNTTIFDISPYATVTDKSYYKKETWWKQDTHYAKFLIVTLNGQKVFDFGELYGQNVEGTDDEYSNYSFQVYTWEGPSAIDVSIPHIDTIHDAWYRSLWLLNKSKPDGLQYSWNAIVAIAQKLYPDSSDANAVTQTADFFEKSINSFYVNDTSNPNLGGGQNPHFPRKNGLSENFKEFDLVRTNEATRIADALGINAIREAYSPSPNDGYKLQMQALVQSRNATHYMSVMIISLLTNFGKHTAQAIQNWIEFKGSRAYNFLEKAIGIHAINSIKVLKKIPMHRFGIFIESFNTDLEKQTQNNEAREAMMKGEISYEVYMLIQNISNPKKAAQVLAYEKSKTQKIKQEQEQASQQFQMQLAADNHKMKMEEIQEEGKNLAMKQNLTNQGLIETKKLDGQNKMDITELKLRAEPQKQNIKTTAKLKEMEQQKRLEDNRPIGVDDQTT